MAYSKVSLICGLLAIILISNGVSARLVDGLFAQIKIEDIHEEDHSSTEPQKPGVEMVYSPAPAPVPEKSTYQAWQPEYQTAIGGGAENDHDEDEGDSSIGSDPSFQPNDTDEDDDNDTDNSDAVPLP